MNAVVLGNGRSGKAAADLLAREGWDVCVLDGDDGWPSGNFGLCVTSPGIPLDHPWQIAARAAGVPVVSELQLGAERYRRMGGRMLAVTGSKGKSSVVKLVADALDGIPCGNYGKPLCEVVADCVDTGTDPKNKLPFAVVEVSSFQMETTVLPPDTFDAAAVLNLQEDHLDRHGSVEVYHALKHRLLDFAVVKIEDRGEEDVWSRGIATGPEETEETGSDPGKSNKNSPDRELFAGSYFDNPVLKENGQCAVALMRVAGLDDAEIRAAFLRFEALPHRMQTIGEFDGVTYIDDSKATSISALIAGVTMAFNSRLHPVRLIAGGLAKGDDPASAADCLAEHVAKVYLIGKSASVFHDAWKDSVPCEECGTLEKAVDLARRESREGDVVLLSPGTASFDQFASYGERGDRFRAMVVAFQV